MKKLALNSFVVMALVTTSLSAAAEPPMMPSPQKEHEWLKQFIGEWETEGEAMMEPGKPPIKCVGTEKVRAVGGFWIQSELTSSMMGMPMTGMMTVGYDPVKKKYIGSWFCSADSHFWKYEGTLDATGKILTLEAEGPNWATPGKMSKYKDVTEFKSDGHRVLTSSIQMDNGEWVQFMTMTAKRKKK